MSQKEWTIMIYMAGDNNLAVDMAYALEQIKEVAREGVESPNLLVYFDGNAREIPTLYCDFSEPGNAQYYRSYMLDKLYLVRGQKGNENAADWKSVVNFVDWCVNRVEVEQDGKITNGRRARRYALIFSGHSLGFQDIGLFQDDSSGKTMTMKTLYETLRRIVDPKKLLEEGVKGSGVRGEERERETTVILGEKLDILGFDSCVMGMLEVGYQFNDIAKTMIASEGSVPSAGWTYAKILGCLARGDHGNATTEQVAENFVRDFIHSQDGYAVGGISVDMAAWDLCRLNALASAFDGLSWALLNCFEDKNSRIYRQMERIILQVHWKCQTYMYDSNVDLGDFCELLDQECGLVAEELGGDDVESLRVVQEECQKVLAQLKEAVLLSGFSGGAYQYSNGISVFFPWSREGYEVSRKNYEGLFFSKEADKKRLSWTGFLKKYLNEVAIRKFEEPAGYTLPGAKYKYFSFENFADTPSAFAFLGGADTKIAGQEGAKIAGQEGAKIAGQEGAKIAGQEGAKIAGQEGAKIAGQEGAKIAGQEGAKIAGQEGAKLGGGSSSDFFARLRLYKNIETRWNISGFSRNPGFYGSEPPDAEN